MMGLRSSAATEQIQGQGPEKVELSKRVKEILGEEPYVISKEELAEIKEAFKKDPEAFKKNQLRWT